MYKLMIVDDEPLLRMAVKSLLDWEANGFKLLQDASNGEAAIELIKKETPDILLTDIKMPVINGVELIKYIKVNYPGIRTIVLSNYDDFDYVKEALVNGAVDYILKVNITPESLINIINNLKEKFLQDEHSKNENLIKDNEIKKNLQRLKTEFMRKLIEGDLQCIDQINYYNNYYQAGIRDGKYVVCSMYIDEWSKVAQKYVGAEREVLQSTINTILDEVSLKGGMHFDCSHNHYVLIIYMDVCSESSFINNVYETLQRFETAAFRYINISFTVGISNIKGKVTDLHVAYKESIDAAAYRFYCGIGRIFKFGELNITDENPGAIWMSKNNLKRIRDFVERGNTDEIKKILMDCTEHIEQTHYEIDSLKQSFVDFIMFLRSVILEQLEDCDACKVKIENVYHNFNSCENYSEVKNLAFKYVTQMLQDSNVGELYKYGDIIQKAIKIIHENYDRNITLHSISETINVNSSYLSRLFLKETGKNFIDYVTELKVKKAMKLLKESNMSVFEIGLKIGIQNPKYFNRVFKKITEVSPYHYRLKFRS